MNMSTVVVGLSGGVDSAVSAYLLKSQGHEVIGAFIKGWEPSFLPCTGAQDRLSAMRVAAHLSIPFVTIDLEQEYESEVVGYFVEEYRRGRTPNPDVMCNRIIKFGKFMDAARKLGADIVATGHYALNFQMNGVRVLGMATDTSKDQTYFLWTLTSEVLNNVMFPIGSMTKTEVRNVAKRIKLPNATRRDSQGLCFLGHVDMKTFLMRYIPKAPGSIRDIDTNTIVGDHEGVTFYTLGEHVPITVHSERMYVVKKDIPSNTLYVRKTPLVEGATQYVLCDENWTLGTPGMCLARYRYRGELVESRVEASTITFSRNVLVAPGQSVVAYNSEGVCLGGATVERVV